MTIKRFIIHLIIMALLLALVIIAVLTWLRFYTNHGQKLELADYIGMNYEEAKKDASDKTFELIINDSIHRVGVSGGEILSQNPTPFSKVKENRKVYVTTAKYNADVLILDELPSLYGKEYESKKRELSLLSVDSEIKDYIYDIGEPDHILEVWQEGKRIVSASGKAKGVTIEKGSKLSFVLSKRGGGTFEIPDLLCQQYSAAKFNLDSRQLKIGQVTSEGEITNESSAYIIAQDPPYRVGATIQMGESINITISSTKPNYCR